MNKNGEQKTHTTLVDTMGIEQARLTSLGIGTTEKHVPGNASGRLIWPQEQGKLEKGETRGREASQEFTEEVLVRTSSGSEKERTVTTHVVRRKLI